MMNIFLDCEFNDYRGQLISIALVADDGQEFYEVLTPFDAGDSLTDWVLKHVIPVLNKEPIDKYSLQRNLTDFLSQYGEHINIICDWPDDIKYLCELLITSPGKMISISSFKMEVCREIDSKKSKVPHNALEDALALKIAYNIYSPT